MNFEQWIKERLEGDGLVGVVTYNQDEDSYQLSQSQMDIGLFPLWGHYESKNVRIKIEVLEERES